MKTFSIGSLLLFLASGVTLAQEIQFEEVTDKAFPASPSGMEKIHDAVFNDFNNDGYPGLLLAARRLPFCCFLKTSKTALSRASRAPSTGVPRWRTFFLAISTMMEMAISPCSP